MQNQEENSRNDHGKVMEKYFVKYVGTLTRHFTSPPPHIGAYVVNGRPRCKIVEPA